MLVIIAMASTPWRLPDAYIYIYCNRLYFSANIVSALAKLLPEYLEANIVL